MLHGKIHHKTFIHRSGDDLGTDHHYLFLIRIMPGSPFEADNLSQSAIEQLESTYGLDEPMWKQYILYMENLMHGDLGISYKKNVSVNTLIARGFPYTLSIGLLSIAVSAFIGILMGIWMATSKRLAVKNTLLGIATLGVSIPGFVTAILLMMISVSGGRCSRSSVLVRRLTTFFRWQHSHSDRSLRLPD